MSINVCSKCTEKLTANEVNYNEGLCLQCGHYSGDTICDIRKIIYHKITHFTLWGLKVSKTVYYGRDEFSENWADKVNAGLISKP